MRYTFKRFWVFTTFAALSTAIVLAQDTVASPPVASQDQDQQTQRGGWRRIPDAAPADSQTAASLPDQTAPAVTPDDSATPATQPPAANPGYRPADAYGQSQPAPRAAYPNQGYPSRPGYQSNNGYQPMQQVPPEVSIKPGTYVTVRIDQALSSDHNHAGDAFSATLAKPLVVDGVIVAQTGQTLGGRVVDAQKAGRVEGTSRLAIELIDMSLVDGSQVPLKTQFVSYTGPTSVGRDVAAVGGTTAFGAAVGAAAAGGMGAGIGAGAGAVAGLVGVLVTRGHQTIIYPESVLTFRIDNPLTISTVRAPQAFRFVDPRDYQQSASLQQRYQATAPQAGSPYPYAYPYAYSYPYAYGYPYYPYYWGPGFSFYYGPRFYGGYGYYRGGGFYHGRR